MAYKILYSQDAAYRYPQSSSTGRIKWGKWLGGACILAALLWLRGNGVPDFLIPGDPAVTKAAAAILIDELRHHIPVNEAVTTFCETIIHGAGL